MANVLVVHGGGPTAVINASLYGVIEEARQQDAIDHVYGAIGGSEAIFKERFLDLMAYPEDKLKLLLTTPATAIGSSRYALEQEDYEAMPAVFKKHDIRYVLLNGGNGTMDTCGKIHRACKDAGVCVVGIPKTVDNDIAITDHTPGYGSAARYLAETVAEVGVDVKSLPIHVCVVEAMGRNAGWITAASALARKKPGDAPHLIYLPEVPFEIEKFMARVRKLLEKKDVVVVAVSEGIRTREGKYISELGSGVDYVDAFGHKQLTGTASYLANAVNQEIGCKTRAVEFSTLQRSAAHLASRVDVNEAFMVGGAAVKAADEGDSGKMVVIDRVSDDPYQTATGIYDVHKIANGEKLVPRDWITKDGTYVTEEFIDYVRPLIQGDSPSVMVDGIPRHLYMSSKK